MKLRSSLFALLLAGASLAAPALAGYYYRVPMEGVRGSAPGGTVISYTLSLSSPTYDFGNSTIGTPTSTQVTVQNLGTGTVTGLTYTPTGDYTLGSGGTCGASLAPTASCTKAVTFTPTAVGLREGSFSVSSANAGTLTASLTGYGLATYTFIATPATPDFGDVTVGNSATTTVTLQNTGSGTLTGLSFQTTGEYALNGGGTCGVTLAPAATCTKTLVFTPTTLGARPGSLVVTATEGSPLTVNLTGAGAPPTVSALLHLDSLPFTDDTGKTVTSAGAVSVSNGAFAEFNGGNLIRISDQPAMPNDFTVEGFVRFKMIGTGGAYTPSNQYIFDFGNNGYSFGWNRSSGWRVARAGGTVIVAYAATPEINRWYHFAVSHSGTTVRLFLDGVMVASTVSTYHPNSATLTLGDYGGGGTYGLNGYLDEFRVTSDTGRYTSDFAVPAVPFVE